MSNARFDWPGLRALTELGYARPVLALRESFLTLLPYFVLGNVVLMGEALGQLSGWTQGRWLGQCLYVLSQSWLLLWPLLVGWCLTLQLARAYALPGLQLLSLMMVLSLLGLNARGVLLPVHGVSLSDWATIRQARALLWNQAFLVPMVTVLCWYLVGQGVRRWVPEREGSLLPRQATLTWLLCLALLALPASHWVSWPVPVLRPLLETLPNFLVAVVSVLGIHLLWWLGVHGSVIWDFLAGSALSDVQVLPDIGLGRLLYAFVYPGGAGAMLGLWLALWWQAPHRRTLLRWTLPFHVVNISEPLSYGLPLVGNPRLLLPFVLAPLLSVAWVWLFVFGLGWVSIQRPASWVLPYGVNAWVLSDQPWRVLALQALCFASSVWVYRQWLPLDSGLHTTLRAVGAQLKGVVPPMGEGASDGGHAGWGQRTQQALRLLQDGRLVLHYQPRVDLALGRVSGMEALLRLHMPDGSMRQPEDFVPVLGQAGFGDVLDSWALRRVDEDRQRWPPDIASLPVAVNISPGTLTQDEAFARLLRELPMLRPGLELEVQEDCVTEAPLVVGQRLAQLRQLGVRIYVDNFGTGNTHLRHFHEADFDAVKLGRSLLQGVDSPRGERLYRAVCGILQRLGYQVLAEGVETPGDVAFVRSCGVLSAQGFHFCTPLMAVALPEGVRRLNTQLKT
ncbi:EAL domain-containing protein [Roseateles sp. BYS180W]|uniref:EAL domain-containing protein n=1 Tax=Roseateles rivi TaxID=3299028 RepID=A0ABW7FRW8_9BURK